MDRRVVITGVGTINPLGSGEEFWDRLTNGESGVGLVSKFDASDHLCKVNAEVEIDPGKVGFTSRELRRWDSFSQYAVIAADLALKDSGLDLSKKRKDVGVIMGTGICGVESIEAEDKKIFSGKGPDRVSPFLAPRCMTNAPAAEISIRYGFQGPGYCVNSACASGLHATISAAQNIQLGMANVIATGGTEAAFAQAAYAAFAKMTALVDMKVLNESYGGDPKRASRPFDAGRSGFVMGEGSGVLILEELEHAKRRGARIYAELAGYGMNSEASHITKPDETGEGMRQVMDMAINMAGVNLDEVDYINAHGTSTPFNDKTETLAIKRLFGDQAYRIPISSTKSMTGHLLGGAGGLELGVCAQVMERGIIPPTINYEVEDPDCDLDYTPNTAREKDVNVVLKNNFGFGGHNASIVLKKYVE